jgi:hypothetical protein
VSEDTGAGVKHSASVSTWTPYSSPEFTKVSHKGLRKNVYLELVDEYPDALSTMGTRLQTNSSSSENWSETYAAGTSLDNNGPVPFSIIPFETSPGSDGDVSSMIALPDIAYLNSSTTDQNWKD